MARKKTKGEGRRGEGERGEIRNPKSEIRKSQIRPSPFPLLPSPFFSYRHRPCLASLSGRFLRRRIGAGRERPIGLSDRGGRRRFALDPARGRGIADVPRTDHRRQAADRLRPAAARSEGDHPRRQRPPADARPELGPPAARPGRIRHPHRGRPSGHRRRATAGEHVRRLRLSRGPLGLPLVRAGSEPHSEAAAAGRRRDRRPPKARAGIPRAVCRTSVSTAIGARGTA